MLGKFDRLENWAEFNKSKKLNIIMDHGTSLVLVHVENVHAKLGPLPSFGAQLKLMPHFALLKLLFAFYVLPEVLIELF